MQQSPAIAKCQRIESLILRLENLYNQALKLDEETKNKLTGFRKIRTGRRYGYEEERRRTTFQEEMELTRLYLKRLGGGIVWEEFTQEENHLMSLAEIPDGLAWECMDEYLEAIIQWLVTILKK